MNYPMAYVYEDCPNCDDGKIQTEFRRYQLHTGECVHCGTTTMINMDTWRGGVYNLPCVSAHCAGCHNLVECYIEDFAIKEYDI